MSDDKRKQQIDQESLKEKFNDSYNREQREDQASYQPEKNELDDNNPPGEDSE